MTNENRPTEKFRAGAVSAALWKNSMTLKNGNQIDTLSVSLDRRYTDSSGNWKSSASLRLNDIPKAILVLQKAYEFMLSKDAEQPATSEENVATGNMQG
ncbi:hypothetical protein BVX94_02245 [bacterium B17]|nr:hypothetical protein BVX94_02245 [bacterium B17]